MGMEADYRWDERQEMKTEFDRKIGLIKSCISRAEIFLENSQHDKDFYNSWFLNAKLEVEKGNNWLNELEEELKNVKTVQ